MDKENKHVNSLERDILMHKIKCWRFFAFGSVFLSFLAIFVMQHPNDSFYAKSSCGSSCIAHIRVDGTIYLNHKRDKAVAALGKNKSIKAVIISINSPGGTVVGSESLFRAINSITAHKPVVAVMEDIAASGAYMAALGSDYIFANGSTITGSIGVITGNFSIKGLMDKLGIKSQPVKSGYYKDMFSFTSDFDAKKTSIIQTLVEDTYHQFLSLVSSRRSLPEEELIDIADGRVVSGIRAQKLHLIDSIGDLDNAVEWLKKEKNIDANLVEMKILSTKDENSFPFSFKVSSILEKDGLLKWIFGKSTLKYMVDEDYIY